MSNFLASNRNTRYGPGAAPAAMPTDPTRPTPIFLPINYETELGTTPFLPSNQPVNIKTFLAKYEEKGLQDGGATGMGKYMRQLQAVANWESSGVHIDLDDIQSVQPAAWHGFLTMCSLTRTGDSSWPRTFPETPTITLSSSPGPLTS